MNLPNRLTLFRIILAPLFFTVYFLPWLTNKIVWTVPLLWIIFIVSEFTDLFDGMAARRLNQTSDFGKLFDPFADTLMQITCFLCFVIDNIIPAALFLVVLYREFGILLIRNYMLQKGITMGARISGKVKTVAYIAAAATALLCTSLRRLNIPALEFLQPILGIAAIVIFAVSVLFSIVSFIDYVFVCRASVKTG
jgi:CDP-diacylglycerol--glycerol-3-phosphate 3-phosphatidyltransferase